MFDHKQAIDDGPVYPIRVWGWILAAMWQVYSIYLILRPIYSPGIKLILTQVPMRQVLVSKFILTLSQDAINDFKMPKVYSNPKPRCHEWFLILNQDVKKYSNPTSICLKIF